MKINRGHTNLFMNNKENIYVMKVINDFNRKEVDYVARRPAPNVDRPRRSARFWSSRRPHRGAHLVGHAHASARGSRNLLSTALTNSSSNYLLFTRRKKIKEERVEAVDGVE